MHISFDVSGYYDWERADLHPGVEITQADVKALRAKQDAQGNWLVRVEKTADTTHGANIQESHICNFIVWQAVHAGNEWSRHDAACELMGHSYKHHGRRDHIKDAGVAHDTGAIEELFDRTVARCLAEYRAQLVEEGLDPAKVGSVIDSTQKICDSAKARYMRADVDLHNHVRSHWAPHAAHAKKGA